MKCFQWDVNARQESIQTLCSVCQDAHSVSPLINPIREVGSTLFQCRGNTWGLHHPDHIRLDTSKYLGALPLPGEEQR